MAKLPAWSWLIVGVIITATSWYVEMPLFFWLGIVFILVGVGKIVFRGVVTEHEVKLEPKAAHHYTQRIPHPPHAAQHTVHHPGHQYYRCACGAAVRASDAFCSHCGRRLR